jgi:hypothetical protein
LRRGRDRKLRPHPLSAIKASAGGTQGQGSRDTTVQ